nr:MULTISPECIES: TonB-dependent receptor [Gluconobacter]
MYFDISENTRTYAESGYKLSNSPFAVSQTAYDDTKSSIRPETAWTYAIGYRYTGDVKSPGYWLTNVGVQYSFGNMKKYNRYLGAIKNLTVAFNGSNLTNKRYISTMGQNGNPADIASGALTDQSMQIGAPRMFFGSVRADF